MNYTRYLRAIETRLDKAKGQSQKDAEKAALAQRYERLFWQAVKTSGEQAESVGFRWLLEEYRISLFAQQIKTTQPVSEKRLEKAWASLY
jgi:ATP-dependent helicase HrpA